jgi:phage/plasmid-like protein (TIGR03299 family)
LLSDCSLYFFKIEPKGDNMSHEVESMMYVGTPPWHGIGVALNHPPTAEIAIQAAGLAWAVETRQLYVADAPTMSPWNVHLRHTDAYRAVVRTDNHRVLGIVGRAWKPLQNTEAFRFFDPFVEAGAAEYHTAGSLKQGQRVWVLARLVGPPMEVAPSDAVERYLLLSNTHDGKTAVNVRFTPIRVVCWNTLTMAEADDTAPFLKVIHKGNVEGTMQAVQDVVSMAHQTFAATFHQYRFLASRQVQNIEQYVLDVLQVPEHQDPKPKAGPKIVQLFQATGDKTPSVQGSYWAAYNAVTAWVDHERGRPASRLDSAWFGDGQQLKRRALARATDLARAA